MNESPIVVLGLGFTGLRLARKLARTRPVFGAARNPERFAELVKAGVAVSGFGRDCFPKGSVVVHTIPPLGEPDQSQLHEFLISIEPRRFVYISATSVYGEQHTIDAASPVAPSTAAGMRRRSEEEWIETGPWTSLILRAAAIYGPGRGAHRRILQPETPRDSQRRGPSGVVSRIYVDDLVALAAAGIDAELTGAFPVADQLPCSTEEILRWSAAYIGLPLVGIPENQSSGRTVDGSLVCQKLGVSLAYPDYRHGIAQCLREEAEEGIL